MKLPLPPDEAPCLVLLPGLACDHRVWTPLLPALAPLARPWVPDIPVCTDIAAMAQAVLAAAPAQHFALAGHSLGGRIALEVLRQAPQRILRLALLDTGWQPRPEGPAGEAEQAQRQALVALARQQGMHAMAERWAPGMLHPDHLGTAVHAQVLAMVADQSIARFEAQQQALLARPDATSLLATIACPCLVLCGAQDSWSPPARHQAMATAIADAHLELVPDSGHMSTMEQPEAVAKALAAWLRGWA